MGLLDDIFSTPGGQLGIGLLAAAGPSFTPMGLGQRFAQAQGYVRDQQNADLNQQLTKAKVNEANMTAAAQALQLRKMQNWMGLWNGDQSQSPSTTSSLLTTGSPESPASPAPTAASGGTPQPAQQQSGFPLTIPAFGEAKSRMMAATMIPEEYLKAYMQYASPQTDVTKVLTAMGVPQGSAQWNQTLSDWVKKQNNIPLIAGRAGAPMYNPDGTIIAMAPKIPDNAVPQIVNGQVVGVSLLPGAAQIEQTNAYAGAAGRGQAEPFTAYDPVTGKPVATNKLAAAQGLTSPQQQSSPSVVNIGQAKISPDLQAFIADDARRNGITNPVANFSGRGVATLTSPFTAQPASATGLTPELPAGFKASQEALATSGAKRYTSLIETASDSPTRVNVYDNILKLSQEGVNSGPGSAWQNTVKGYIANTPFLASVSPNNWKNDVAGFQELNKFLYQNAQRNWQAAGGTGTDAQLESFTRSNPNDKMFPQALQAMAQWGKAGELALQGKANAAQQWKDDQSGNVANQDQFEKTWRNNFDPLLFQLKTMSPEQAEKTVEDLKKNKPNVYANLMMKAKALKNIGGL